MSPDPFDAVESVDYDPESETYRAAYDSTSARPSAAVVEVFAAIQDTEPTLVESLYESIDPEALDQFLTTPPDGHRPGDRTVSFTFQDHRVTVRSHGIITVEPPEGGDSTPVS